MDKIFEMKLDAFGGVECFILGGVEYARKEKSEPEPRTGDALKVDGKRLLIISAMSDDHKFREDPKRSRAPDIVDADGKIIGYVSIRKGEVSVE